jgi:diguanylate cyclase (GGDEF)-like protein
MPHSNLTDFSRRTRSWFNATTFGLLMVALVWLGIFAKHIENRAHDRTSAVRDTENMTLLFEENVLRSIGEMDKAILYLRRTIETTAAPKNYGAIVNTTDVLSALIVQVAVIDAGGIMRASNVGPQPAPPTDLSDREHFRYHLDRAGDQLFVSKPLIGRASGRWSVQLTRRLSKPDGRFDGVVVASFNPDHFAKFYGRIDLGAGSSFALVGMDGIVRAAGGQAGIPRYALGQAFKDTALLERTNAGRDGAFTEIARTSGEEELVSMRKVTGHPLAVVVSMAEPAIYEDSTGSLKFYAPIGVLLSLMIAVVTMQARKAERQVKLKARQLQVTLEHMSQGIMMVTKDLSIPIMNRKCAELLELPADYLVRPPTFAELMQYQEEHGEFAQALLPENLTPMDVFGPGDAAGKFEMYERVRPNGTVLEVRSARLDDGGFVRTFTDVTRRMKAQSEADRLASQDVLTGLANRRVLGEALDRLTASTVGTPIPSFAILCLDLDRFKIVNDTQGHAVGDLLLKAVAKRMKQSLRSSDLVARLGGDEFAVLLESIDREVSPEIVAQRLVETISRPYDIDGHQLIIGASIGIALGPADAATTNEVLIAADLALYAAKSAGRGTYRFFAREMNEEIRARQEIETDLRAALIEGQLELYYQPVVALADRRIVGFEALARWNHPHKGLVTPDKFIPVAEDCGLIEALGVWALRAACKQAMQWPDQMRIAVNLSPSQFASASLADTVERVLVETGLPARRLELEITEGLLMRNTDRTLATLHRLKALGLRIAMDDFGTGYSSLSYLQSFPFDKIKVDRSFVRDVATSTHAGTVVRSVIDIAAALGMTTTAEGVETEDQCARLQSLGCDEAQGYLFGRPQPVRVVDALLAADRHREVA